MNTELLLEIVGDATAEFRKGAAVTTDTRTPGLEVVHVYAMPHVDEIPAELEQVDVHFEIVGVDRERAEARRDDLLGVLREWPDDCPEAKDLSKRVQAERHALIAHDSARFDVRRPSSETVVTPERLGMTGELAEQAAGAGYVMVTGFRDPRAEEATKGER